MTVHVMIIRFGTQYSLYHPLRIENVHAVLKFKRIHKRFYIIIINSFLYKVHK